jgi:hypothetical protein
MHDSLHYINVKNYDSYWCNFIKHSKNPFDLVSFLSNGLLFKNVSVDYY